jgi:hypothetical protein
MMPTAPTVRCILFQLPFNIHSRADFSKAPIYYYTPVLYNSSVI